MFIRNLRVVPVLLRYAGFRKISIGRRGLSESLPVQLASSHNVIRDVQRRTIELVYEPGELPPAARQRALKAASAAAGSAPKPVDAAAMTPAPKVDGIAERMLERLRMIRPEGVPAELERLRRMAGMNAQMAPTVGRVIRAYEEEQKTPEAVQVVTAEQPAATITESPGEANAHMDQDPVPQQATPEQRYSRTGVRGMRRDALRGLAREVGVADCQSLTVQELKDALISKLPPI